MLKPGKSAKLTVTLGKAGSFIYSSTVAGDSAKGMKGSLTVKAAASTGAGLASGKAVFVSTGCGACHALKAAGTTGMVGPNLDRSTMKQAAMVSVIANGKGTMQAYAGMLNGTQIQDVATFVVASRTG